MFSRLLGKPKPQMSTVDVLSEMNSALTMLEKKEQVLSKKIAIELEKAREFSRAKNKKGAVTCLKRKKMYENQIDLLSQYQLRIHDQMITLEGAQATAETVGALKSGADALQAMHKATNINNLDETLDQIAEQSDQLKQIQDVLSNPIGGQDFDEDDLLDELNDLEEQILEDDLLKPTTTVPPTRVAGQEQAQPQAARRPAPARKTPPVAVSDEDELAALQREMAI